MRTRLTALVALAALVCLAGSLAAQRRFFYGVQEAKGIYADLAGRFELGPTGAYV